MNKILATGMSGLVGTRISDLLKTRFEFEDLSLATGIDISNRDDLVNAFESSDSPVVLHMAAKTDVDGCEDDKLMGEEGVAWVVNVEGTRNVVEAAEKTGKRVIYISTDFVFDGTKDRYNEEDEPNPVSWYGYTKYLGEEEVKKSNVGSTILRISYPYRNRNSIRSDFLHRMLEAMEKNHRILALTDHIFTPTFVDDIAAALDLFLTRHLPGIYHVVGSTSLPAIDAVKLISETFGVKTEIEPITREKYFRNRAFRPLNLTLKNDKILKLGLQMLAFEEGLKEIKKQDLS